MCMCDFLGSKVLHIFHSLFVYAVYWENMNGSIFIRGAVQGKTCRGGCSLMTACKLGWKLCFMKLFFFFPELEALVQAPTHLFFYQLCIHKHMSCLFLLFSVLHCFLFILTAPMELPMKNRSFSLTSHQLRALTQLACTLLGFERTVKKLVTNMTFIDCTGETPCVKGGTASHK